MKATRYVLFTALGIGAVLLLTSDRAKELREDLEEKAKVNAKRLKDRLAQLSSDTTSKLSELQTLLNSEMEGLSDEARERIQNILDRGTRATRNATTF